MLSCWIAVASVAVANRARPPQPTCSGRMGSDSIFSSTLDSATPHSASLSYGPLCRYASLVRAVCVNAHVRISAGGRSVMSVPTATVAVEHWGGGAALFRKRAALETVSRASASKKGKKPQVRG